MTNFNRYTKVTRWAQRRYTRNGALVISIGLLIDGKGVQMPSTYSRIETAAWNKYVVVTRDDSGAIVFQG